ncbi:MAG: NAD(P)-dependent oxidoreductase [Planctomycetes bacterium]|nr:NAD(P)-dependent oxidoreductase [Planctomycetota bacterium]
MATLIVGGNGLVGVRLIQQLCDKGEEVISFSSRPAANPTPGCRYVQGDVTEYGTLNMIYKDHSIERVIHNAAVSHPKLLVDNPYKIYRINVTGTLTSLEAARNYGVKRFIYMSSGAVYGNVSLKEVPETTPLHSENPYGATKVACEELVRNYGLESAALRIGFIYGPGRVFECPINSLLSDIIKNGSADWDHGIDQRLDYIYIDDCVDATIAIAFADTIKHSEYNVGGGEDVPFGRVVDAARKVFPKASIKVGPGTLGYDNLGALAVKRAEEDYGWKPKVSIEQGVARYAEWLQRHG